MKSELTLRVVLFFASAVIAVACQSEPPSGPREVVHPLPELLLSYQSHITVSQLNSLGSPPTTGNVDRLALFDTANAMGTLGLWDSPDDSLFGHLTDALIDARGNVLLLDAHYGHVRVFSPQLKPIQILGSLGDGPGEFVGPETLLWMSRNELGVFDPKATRIETFRRMETRYEHSGSVRLVSLPVTYDACGAMGRLFAQGVRLSVGGQDLSRTRLRQVGRDQVDVVMSGFLHEFDRSGMIRGSYSVPYQGMEDLTLANYYTEYGGVACDEGRVWVAYGALGEIHALTDNGDLLWIARIQDLEAPGHIFRYGTDGRPTRGSGALNVDMLAGNYSVEWIDRITLLSRDLLAVDVLVRTIGDPSDNYPAAHGHRTYLLDAVDGSQVGSFSADHWILGGGRGKAILYRETPFPQVDLVILEE